MKERDDNREENCTVTVEFYGEKKDLQINSNFNCTIKSIFSIFNIPPNQINAFTLSYFDEDGDSILLSTEEDYKIFFQQIKEKSVNTLIVEINNNPKIAPNPGFDITQNNEKQIAQANNQINKGNNNLINNNNNELNNINNINSSNNFNNNKNSEINKNIINNEVPINDIIFEYKCNCCSICPIICILYYCPQCKMYLCEDCSKNVQNHIHPILKIESKNELKKIMDDENNEIKNINNNSYIRNGFNDYYDHSLITKNYPNVQDNNYYNNNNYNPNIQHNYPNNHHNNSFNHDNNHINREDPILNFANNFLEFITKPIDDLFKIPDSM